MKCQVNPRYMEQLYSFYSPFYEYVFGKLLGPGRRKAFKYVPRLPDQRVLEIGVGPGSTLDFYPPRTKLTGIDISRAMIERARQKPPISTAAAASTFTSWTPPTSIFPTIISTSSWLPT